MFWQSGVNALAYYRQIKLPLFFSFLAVYLVFWAIMCEQARALTNMDEHSTVGRVCLIKFWKKKMYHCYFYQWYFFMKLIKDGIYCNFLKYRALKRHQMFSLLKLSYSLGGKEVSIKGDTINNSGLRLNSINHIKTYTYVNLFLVYSWY